MDSNLVVVKDNKIITAAYRLTLVEQRIILAAIAKIDSTKSLSETHGFTIQVAEIQDLVSGSNNRTSAYSEIKKAVDSLYNRSIKIDGDGSERRWIYEKRYNKRAGSVTLFFSPTLIPYLSQLKSNFTKYRLEYVKKFSSSYSIRIYEMLIQWTSRGEREIELDLLKNMLELSKKYTRTNNFIQKVIKPAVIEINQHSNINVVFGTRKSGTTITHIQFKFEIKKQKNNEIANQRSIEKFVRENPVITRGLTTQEVLNLMRKN